MITKIIVSILSILLCLFGVDFFSSHKFLAWLKEYDISIICGLTTIVLLVQLILMF